jgi:hypothetical protein
VSTIPAAFSSLVDDAAIFPPGNASLPDALDAHRHHRSAAYADLVGPLVVSDVALPDLMEAVRVRGSADPLAVSVVVTGGAGAIEPAVRWATRAEELELAAVELGLRDEEDLPRNARRVTTVVEQLRAVGELGDDVPVYVEPPRVLGPQPPTSWLSALDEVAATDLRLKFRTGGVTADAFPGIDELATCIDASLDRELPFKCTAGLHHALRHHDEETGFDHHGFLNVLAATRAALDGASVPAVAEVLATTEAVTVRDGLLDAGPDGLVSARRWFVSFGSCSVLEPLEDLIELDLLPDLPLEGA